VSEKERSHQLEDLLKEIAAIVADKCVNPDTQRPYPVTLIERAIHDEIHYSVHPTRNAKQQVRSNPFLPSRQRAGTPHTSSWAQALDVIRLLKEKMPIERAQMRVRVVLPAKEAKRIRERLAPFLRTVEREEWGGDLDLVRECAPW
jgi:ribosome maturation protein SDO1